MFGLRAPQQGLSSVPITDKREAVWRRLGELAGHMRLHGVAEHKIADLLRYHTPMQIELAFKNMPRVHPDAVADVLLNGRYGYRAGLKKNKQPPDTRVNARFLKQRAQQEAKCPVVTPPQVQSQLEAYLESLCQ